MSLGTWWEQAAGDFLPWRCDAIEVCAVSRGVYQGAGGPCVQLQLLTYGDEDGRRVVTRISEQEIPLYVAPDIEEAHVRALLEGTDLAFSELVARYDGKAEPMPADFFCPPLLLERLESAQAVRARLLEPKGPLYAWRRLSAPLDAEDEAFAAFCAAGGQPPVASLEANRDVALTRARAGGLAARMKEVYALPLPESVLVARAFFEALTPLERGAYRELGLLQPVNILEWPLDGAAPPRGDGLPGSLVWRFARDPAELVTLFTGDGDGEHIGLFYDDGKHPACGLALSHARDTAETGWFAPTALDAVRARLVALAEQGAERFADVDRAGCLVRLVRDALDRFEPANAEARARDQEAALVPYARRRIAPLVLGGIAPVDEWGSVERVPRLQPANRTALTDDERAAWLTEAYARIGAGDAVASLTIVRCLHWDASEAFEARVLPLLPAAYQALNRPELAAIAETHAAHRWSPSVVT